MHMLIVRPLIAAYAGLWSRDVYRLSHACGSERLFPSVPDASMSRDLCMREVCVSGSSDRDFIVVYSASLCSLQQRINKELRTCNSDVGL